MCGLLAFHTADKIGFQSADRDSFRQMLILTSLRGNHSTGVAGISKNVDKNDVSIVKTTGSPYALFAYTKTDEFLTRMFNEFGTVIGHCRYATRGEITAVNAHPFEEEHITLAHNGVINNYHQLRDYKRHSDITVDSHLIARMFAEEHPLDILPKVEGAYVFMWINSEEGSFNIARNLERPLFVSQKEHQATLAFASEAQTLSWNSSRNNMKCSEPTEIKPFHIYTYPRGSIEPVITEYKPEPKKVIIYPNQGGHERQHHKNNDNFSKVTPIDKKVQKKGSPHEADETDILTLNTALDVTLEVNQVVNIWVDDYEDMDGYTVIRCYSDEYPNVEFYINTTPEKAIEILDADSLRGNVNGIHLVPSEKTDKGLRWRAYVSNFVFVYEPSEQKTEFGPVEEPKKTKVTYKYSRRKMGDMLKIVEYPSGELIKVSRRTFLTWCEKGCSWCQSEITQAEADNYQKLFLMDDEVICRSCSDTVRN